MWDWSDLPPEIIHMISLRIDNPFDLIHFRSVCSPWRSSSLSTFRPIPSLRCPLPPDDGGYGYDCHVLRSRVYLITKSLPCAPPKFWLFKLREYERGAISLQCLLTRRNSKDWERSYPSLSIDLLDSQVIELAEEHVASYTFWCDLYDKGIPYTFGCNLFGNIGPSKRERWVGLMQLDSNKKEFMVFGKLSFRGLGVYKSFDERWTEIEITRSSWNHNWDPETSLYPERITSFKGKIYAMHHDGVTRAIKPTLELNSFQRSRPCDKTRRRWLVKSEDKLLLVEMCSNRQYGYYEAKLLAKYGWFEISELNEEGNDWIQMEDPGGRVLFVDDNCSFSCLPSQIPGFKPNSIIFEDRFGSCKHQVFEFGKQGFRTLRDIPEYIQFIPSFPWLISNE